MGGTGEKGESGRKPGLRTATVVAAAFLACFLVRLPLLIYPPAGYFYNMDELAVTFCALDRFLGLPPTLLMLPATFLQFCYLPLFLLDTFIRTGLPLSSTALLTHLSAQLSEAYSNPHHAVLLMRCLVAAFSSAAPILAYFIVDALSGAKWASLLGAAVVLFDPTFVHHSVMAGGDSVAVTFVLAAMLCLLKTRAGGRVHYAGFLLATALACRITVAGFIFIPILFLLIDDRVVGWRERVKTAARFGASLVLGFIFWCPYVWTDPIRMAKAVYGNLNRPESYFDWRAFMEIAWEGMGAGWAIAGLLVFVAGCLIVLRYRHALGVATVGGSLLIGLPLILRSSSVMPRYFLPLLPCFVLLLGVVAADGKQIYLSRPVIRSSFSIMLVILVAIMAVECVEKERDLRGPGILDEAVSVIQSMPKGAVLYVPEWAFAEGRFQFPRQACERLHTKLQDMTGVLHFEAIRGIPPDAAEVLVTDFNEKEQAWAAHMRIMCPETLRKTPSATSSCISPRMILVWSDPLSDMDYEKALEQVGASPNAMILVQGLKLPGSTPYWTGKGDNGSGTKAGKRAVGNEQGAGVFHFCLVLVAPYLYWGGGSNQWKSMW